MSKASTMAGFVAGLVIGGAAAWYYAREMYSRIAEEEINSVKEAYARQKEQAEERPRTQAAVSPNKPDEKMDIRQYAQKVLKEGYTDYSHTVADKKPAKPTGAETYVISPDEFGEIEEYTKVSLFYFEDGTLADEYGEVVDDVEEIVGDGLEHFGEYEEDSVFMRNDAKRCDYEILRDLRTFAEFKRTLSPEHDNEEA